MIIGIYGISSQSGKAYFADYISKGYTVIGYTRPTEHGQLVVNTILQIGGIYLERPQNSNNELSRFVPLKESYVTNDVNQLVSMSDIIIIALPSTFHESAVNAMCDAGLSPKKTPLVLSPSRTFSSPYIWKIIGNKYPIVCFSTCPYSCKSPKPEVAYIKRRKRTWNASLEGDFTIEQLNLVRELFPQAALSSIPALTSLNNIGAVFHCATYLLNYDEIKRREADGELFSFYMDGIAKRPDVGEILERIDQVRLEIANKIGLGTFGLKEKPREDVWRKLTNGLRALEEETDGDIEILRKLRGLFSEYLNTNITSGQHWLDITYGVVRIEGESLSDAIGRTSTYQKYSIPQTRYLTEDIPTGLVPLEALAQILEINCSAITSIINMYDEKFGLNVRDIGRNLREFDKEYILDYLKGDN